MRVKFPKGWEAVGSAVAWGALPTAAVAVTTLSGGGFSSAAQARFIVLAAAALFVAATFDPAAVARAARAPLALVLLGLTILSVASVMWTIGAPADSLRSGLVIGAYAAMFLAGAVLVRRAGALPVAIIVATLALLEAVLGLRAVALHALPDAERLGRVWRPGGTFEYPPALALLEVAALPILPLAAMVSPNRLLAGAAGAAALLAGAVLGVSGSRLSAVLAVVLLVMMLVLGPDRERRPASIAAALLVLIGALVVEPLLGGSVGPAARPAGSGALLGLVAIALGGGVAWVLAQMGLSQPRGRWIAVGMGAVALAAAIAVQVGHRTSPASARAVRAGNAVRVVGRPAPSSSLLHGRGHQWNAALQTWLDRPVLGAGAGSYYLASVRHQTVDQSRFAHNLPLELAAELGVVGLLLGVALYVTGVQLIYRGRAGSAAWLLAPLVAIFLISNLLDWTWHLAGLGAVWSLAAGALAADADSPERRDEAQLS